MIQMGNEQSSKTSLWGGVNVGRKRDLEPHKDIGSLYVFGKLPTYPSPESTLTLTSHLGQREG